MHSALSTVTLRNFRSYDEAAFEFDPGVNIIIGPNAVGKTNLLEAVYLSCFGKGFRTKSDSELLQNDKQWSRVDSVFGLLSGGTMVIEVARALSFSANADGSGPLVAVAVRIITSGDGADNRFTPTAPEAQTEYGAVQTPTTTPTTPDPVTPMPSAGPGVCDKHASPGFECIDYKGASFVNSASTLETSCPTIGGTWIASPGTCPAGIVATCTTGAEYGADYVAVKNYYAGFAAAKEADCTADADHPGVWQAM